ncbi:MAG: NAD(P)H-binding protein [Desulfatibacillum sp.]|nr:NAD(P)H-binding protein [Desulfatibacillum sp.]
MKEQTIMLAGGTGLVGSHCLKFLQDAAFCKHIKVVTRKPVPVIESFSKARQFLVDFDNPETLKQAGTCDAVICAMGTTIKKAGSPEAFKKVDFTYCLEVARAGLAGGARHFLLVTAMGSSPRSKIFYNRIKGELEQAVMALGFPCVSVFRPSLILGAREESRSGEELGRLFSRMFGFAIPAKYKAIQAADIARAIVGQAAECRDFSQIFESHEIRALGQEA